MQTRILYIMLGLVAFILIARASVFTVSEGQLAIKSIGGEIIDANYEPGLHFRIPLVNEVTKFDKRIITHPYSQERFLTKEQEQLIVDFYVKWRIGNLRKFYESTGGSEDVANDRLGETIKDSIKTVVTQRTLQQVVTADRADFTEATMKDARPAAEQLGVNLIDVRITKIDLPSQVRDSVYERMRATFKAQAAKLRAEGVEVRVAMHFDNIQTIKEAVALGSGASILPARTMQAEIAQGRLVAVPLREPDLVRPLGIVHQKRKKLNRAAQAFLALVTEPGLPENGRTAHP